MLDIVVQVPGIESSGGSGLMGMLLPLALVGGILAFAIGYRLLRSEWVPPGIRARFGMIDDEAERRR
jgi:hypothetical protein